MSGLPSLPGERGFTIREGFLLAAEGDLAKAAILSLFERLLFLDAPVEISFEAMAEEMLGIVSPRNLKSKMPELVSQGFMLEFGGRGRPKSYQLDPEVASRALERVGSQISVIHNRGKFALPVQNFSTTGANLHYSEGQICTTPKTEGQICTGATEQNQSLREVQICTTGRSIDRLSVYEDSIVGSGGVGVKETAPISDFPPPKIPKTSRAGPFPETEIQESRKILAQAMNWMGANRGISNYTPDQIDDTLCREFLKAGSVEDLTALIEYFRIHGQIRGRNKPAYFISAAWHRLLGVQWPGPRSDRKISPPKRRPGREVDPEGQQFATGLLNELSSRRGL